MTSNPVQGSCHPFIETKVGFKQASLGPIYSTALQRRPWPPNIIGADIIQCWRKSVSPLGISIRAANADALGGDALAPEVVAPGPEALKPRRPVVLVGVGGQQDDDQNNDDGDDSDNDADDVRLVSQNSCKEQVF